MEDLILIYCIIIFLIIGVIAFLLISGEEYKLNRENILSNKIRLIYGGATLVGLLVLHINWMLLPWRLEEQGLIPLLNLAGFTFIYLGSQIYFLFNIFKKKQEINYERNDYNWEEEINLQIIEILK
ncbi:hypothetical protein BH23BAC1_BH23BAC1_27340 [soil metagenome]